MTSHPQIVLTTEPECRCPDRTAAILRALADKLDCLRHAAQPDDGTPARRRHSTTNTPLFGALRLTLGAFVLRAEHAAGARN